VRSGKHEVLITDDGFRIAMRPHAIEVCIEHRCHHPEAGKKSRWYPHVWSVAFRGNPCSWCHWRASVGLQASFWFLKEANK
jgi:hypothetical protein